MADGIQMTGFPTQGEPTDPGDHPATNLAPYPNKVGRFESTMQVGDYAMPRAGKTSDYKVKGKDK